jgi:hypothetical protein
MRKNLLVFAISLVGLSSLAGCGGGSGSTPPPAFSGFYVSTTYGPQGAIVKNPDVEFEATSGEQLITCSPASLGSTSGCVVDTGNISTNSEGAYTVTTNDVPDYWGFQTYSNANCSLDDTYTAMQIDNGNTAQLQCGESSILFQASPATYVYGYLQSNAAPTSITLTAAVPAFPTSPSLPTVDSYDESADLQASMAASSVASGNQSLAFPVSSSILTAGEHILVVRDAYGNVIGAAPFSVYYVVPPVRSPCPTVVTKKGVSSHGINPMIPACPVPGPLPE